MYMNTDMEWAPIGLKWRKMSIDAELYIGTTWYKVITSTGAYQGGFPGVSGNPFGFYKLPELKH